MDINEKLKEGFKIRELLCTITYRDIKIRYKQSVTARSLAALGSRACGYVPKV
jgi:hypothetical protein